MMTFCRRESFSEGVPRGGRNQQIGCGRLIKNLQKENGGGPRLLMEWLWLSDVPVSIDGATGVARLITDSFYCRLKGLEQAVIQCLEEIFPARNPDEKTHLYKRHHRRGNSFGV
jgi:hypothetical protein